MDSLNVAQGNFPPNPEQDPTESSYLNRETPTPDASRAALVKKMSSRIASAKKHWQENFKQMRDDMDFLGGDQWPGEIDKKNKYVANITQRHVQQRVSALYAKNPRIVASRRQMMDFSVWDEKPESLLAAQQAMMMAPQTGVPISPQIQALVQDVIQGSLKRTNYNKIAKSMELVFEYTLREQQPTFKSQMKQLVRRTCACGVGYVKLGFQRVMKPRPEDVDKITDVTQQLATLERLIADKLDDKISETSAEIEQLRLLLADLENQPQVIVKEGVVFDFPRSSTIIVDPQCQNLRGFVGAQWVAQEYILDVNQIKEIYKVDISTNYRAYVNVNNSPTVQTAQEKDRSRKLCCVWEIYNKEDGLVYVVAEGYNEFLKEPSEPDIKLERFWPFFTLSFNDIENDRNIYPPSDVALMRPMQREYNRARQALREHRIANRPKTAVPAGMLTEEDIEKLQTHPANAVIILQALQPGQSVQQVLQPVSGPPIDPRLYDTEVVFTDVQRVSGSSEANLGGTSSATATESSISESSRMSSLASNIDDLDDMLSDLARAAGMVMLLELSEETVKSIAGPGAVWPSLTANEVAQELSLDIEAGSSGRPNQSLELSNFEKLAPFLLQIPGINPLWLAREAIRRFDDKIDLDDAIMDKMQSIVSMNSAKQPSTGDPQTDPNAQGAQGGNNAQSAPPQSPPQLTHPAPEMPQ